MIYSLTHIADLDGMASAALLVRNYGMDIGNIVFVNYGNPEFGNAMDSISGIGGPGNALVITDFSMTEENSAVMNRVLSGFKKKGNMIIWLDHHPWGKSLVAGASGYCDVMIVGENPCFCGAELTYRLLCKKDRYSDELMRITHLSDFWLKSKSKRDNDLVNNIAFGLRHLRSYADSEDRMREFVSGLAGGNLYPEVVDNSYKDYMKKTRPVLRGMLKTCSVVRVNGIRIGIGFGRVLSAQEACMAIIERLKCDVGIYVSVESLHGSMRSKRREETWGIDILKLAGSMSGGGHPLAAGFSIEHSGYDLSKAQDRKRVVERIRETAERLYKKSIPYFQQNTGKHVTKSHHSR